MEKSLNINPFVGTPSHSGHCKTDLIKISSNSSSFDIASSRTIPLSPALSVHSSIYADILNVNFCNIRSVCNKLNIVESFLNSVNVDFLFLTETWLNSNFSDSMICPYDYDIVRQDRTISKGGGVCVFFKSTLKVTEIRSNIVNQIHDDMYDYLCIDVHNGNKTIRLLCLYIPPISSRNNDLIMHVCKVIFNLLSCSVPCYIFGDFNLPSINWNIPASEGDVTHESFLNFCLSNDLRQCISEPTHEKGNVLDLLLCNRLAYNNLLCSSVNSPLASTCDHLLISF